jgi:hypothetical protein
VSDIRNKYVAPGIDETAFNCPHCGALASQRWYSIHADPLGKDNIPLLVDPERVKSLDLSEFEDPDERERFKKWAVRMALRRPFFDHEQKCPNFTVGNLSISECFNCDELAVWIYDRVVWPTRGDAPSANTDLPGEVRDDYEEAGRILDLSPRGAAALLRLGLQKAVQAPRRRRRQHK